MQLLKMSFKTIYNNLLIHFNNRLKYDTERVWNVLILYFKLEISFDMIYICCITAEIILKFKFRNFIRNEIWYVKLRMHNKVSDDSELDMFQKD